MLRYYAPSYHPSGNHYVPECSPLPNEGVPRNPRFFVDSTRSTDYWIVGSNNGQFLIQSRGQSTKLDRLDFSDDGINVTLEGDVVPERPLQAFIDEDGMLVPLSNPDSTSQYSAAVPLPDGGRLFVSKQNRLQQVDADGVSVSDPDVSLVDRPLRDATITYSTVNKMWAIFHGETLERNTHGALGNREEGYKLSTMYWDESTNTIKVAETITLEGNSLVYEGLAPMWGDINGDGIDDVLTTISGLSRGAALRAYLLSESSSAVSADGAKYGITSEASSPFIGTDDRWLHQLGVGPFGPNGEIEIIQMRTPHIGGIIRFHHLVTKDDGSQELKSILSLSEPTHTSHDIRSRNLDMVTIGDFNGDGIPEVVVPNFESDKLVGWQRTGTKDVEEVWCVPIPKFLDSNIAVSCGINDTTTAVGNETTDTDTDSSTTSTTTIIPRILVSTRNHLVRIQFESNETYQFSGTGCSGCHSMYNIQQSTLLIVTILFFIRIIRA